MNKKFVVIVGLVAISAGPSQATSLLVPITEILSSGVGLAEDATAVP